MPRSSISPTRIFAGAAATLLVLLVSIFLSFQRFIELRTADSWNKHTYEVLLKTSHLLRGLINIQTGSRGFLQTGDETFLAPYRTGLEEYYRNYGDALAMTKDRPDQQQRLQDLNRQYTGWLSGHIEPLISMRRAAPDSATAMRLAAPGARRRKAAMDQMRATVAAVEKTELDLLRERTRREDRLQALTQTTLMVNGVFAAVLVTSLSFFLVAGTRDLQRKNQQLLDETAQREKAEREARVLHDHNKMILEAAQDGITGVNQAGRITFFNPAAELLTGYTEEEVLGKSQHEVLHCKRADGSPYPVAESPIATPLKEGRALKLADDVVWRKDGQPVPVEFTSAPLVQQPEEDSARLVWSKDGSPQAELKDGKIVGAVTVFRDITERKKAELGLLELASIVQNSDDSIIGLSLDGTVRRWNEAATRVYGYAEYEMLGRPLSRLVPPEMVDELYALLEKVRNREPVERYETTHQRKDGSTVQVVASMSPIIDQQGRVVGASSISRETFRSRRASDPAGEPRA